MLGYPVRQSAGSTTPRLFKSHWMIMLLLISLFAAAQARILMESPSGVCMADPQQAYLTGHDEMATFTGLPIELVFRRSGLSQRATVQIVSRQETPEGDEWTLLGEPIALDGTESPQPLITVTAVTGVQDLYFFTMLPGGPPVKLVDAAKQVHAARIPPTPWDKDMHCVPLDTLGVSIIRIEATVRQAD